MNLHWYEWIGWAVNILMAAMAVTFACINVMEDEMRAAGIGSLASLILICVWTWILLFFQRPKEATVPEEQDRMES